MLVKIKELEFNIAGDFICDKEMCFSDFVKLLEDHAKKGYKIVAPETTCCYVKTDFSVYHYYPVVVV